MGCVICFIIGLATIYEINTSIVDCRNNKIKDIVDNIELSELISKCDKIYQTEEKERLNLYVLGFEEYLDWYNDFIASSKTEKVDITIDVQILKTYYTDYLIKRGQYKYDILQMVIFLISIFFLKFIINWAVRNALKIYEYGDRTDITDKFLNELHSYSILALCIIIVLVYLIDSSSLYMSVLMIIQIWPDLYGSYKNIKKSDSVNKMRSFDVFKSDIVPKELIENIINMAINGNSKINSHSIKVIAISNEKLHKNLNIKKDNNT